MSDTKSIRILLVLFALLIALPVFSEDSDSEEADTTEESVETAAEEKAKPKKTITVMPSVDTSVLNAAQPIQQALGQLFFQNDQFNVQFSNYSLSAFREAILTQTFQRLDSDLLAFAYLEPERISLFLFDWNRPKEYVVVSMPFVPIQGQSTQAYQMVQYYLQTAFNQLLFYYNEEQFQPLPGLEDEVRQLAEQKLNVDFDQKKSVTKNLFLEFAQSYDSESAIGIDIGMARLGASGQSTSVVQLGLKGNYRFNQDWAAELGIHLFNYALAQASVKYYIPVLKNNYLSLFGMGTVGMVMGTFSEVLGFMPTNYASGSIVFGPGFGLSIPLLGAQITGDVRFLLGGGGTILLASYGVAYAL